MRRTCPRTAPRAVARWAARQVRLPHALEVREERIDDVDGELARLHAAIDAVREEMRALRAPCTARWRTRSASSSTCTRCCSTTRTAARPRRPDPQRPLFGRLRPAPAARPHRRGVRRHGRSLPRSRVDDIDQVIGRVHAALHRREADLQGVAGEILVTDNVAPAELAQLQSRGVMAVVTSGGSALSHSAIMARSLHLPLIVGAAEALQNVNDGDVLVVDGGSGLLIREPDAADLRDHRERLREQARERKPTAPVAARTLAHPRRRRHQAVGERRSLEDVAEAHALGAAGVNLYRTGIPVPAARRGAGRGGTVPRLPRPGAGHDRAHRHHPHPRPGRGQGRPHRPGPARRAEPRARPARHPPVAGARRCSKPSCARSCAPPATARCACCCR